MKYSEKINKYLKGEEFSNSLEISFAGLLEDKSRNQKLIEICSNKRVIHFGCADHIELIDQKIAANRWLHKLLVENTSDCIGIDIDKKAVDYITNTLRYKQVYCLDIEMKNLIFASKPTMGLSNFREVLNMLTVILFLQGVCLYSKPCK